MGQPTRRSDRQSRTRVLFDFIDIAAPSPSDHQSRDGQFIRLELLLPGQAGCHQSASVSKGNTVAYIKSSTLRVFKIADPTSSNPALARQALGDG
jgi:hypothetical protein